MRHAARRNGLSAEDAARAVGVPKATLFRWDRRRQKVRLKPTKTGLGSRADGLERQKPFACCFIVPIGFKGSSVTSFILVPYFGACVHVPPPPNQLVFVTTETPYESEGLFEAVNGAGVLGTDPTSARLAEIGYALSADRIEPCDW